MTVTKYELKIIKSDFETPVASQVAKDAIFVEDAEELHCVSQIILSGKFNRTYNVVTYFLTLNEDRVLVDGDLLIITLFSELAIVDLKQDRRIRTVDFNDCYEIFGIYRFKSGYFLRCEGCNYFLDKDFNVVWENGCVDIFANFKIKNDFEIHEEYITVYDWYGYKHFYNESGEFKTEYCRLYDCRQF